MNLIIKKQKQVMTENIRTITLTSAEWETLESIFSNCVFDSSREQDALIESFCNANREAQEAQSKKAKHKR